MGIAHLFFGWGDETLYGDITLEMTKRWTRDFNTVLSYTYQTYNYQAGHGMPTEDGDKMVNSHIVVAEGKYKFTPKIQLRGELQYLATRQDQKDWSYGLLELSIPNFVFSISDLWNNGSTKKHYYMAAVTYLKDAHNIQLMYGRTRAGFMCVGGACRYVPSMKGLFVNYSFNF